MTTAITTAKESPERTAIINSAIERILAQPLTYPPFDLNEACFHGARDGAGSKAGRVKVRILRGLRAKSGSGSDQILIEGVVVATHKLDCPPSQYPRDNPEGWDVYAYGETKTEMPLKDPETGMPLYKRDENGMEIVDETGNKIPETMLCFAPIGYRDVTGYRFVYAGTLTQGVAAEMCIKNLRLLGWKPGRVKPPLTGMSTTDFVPADGMEAVSAEDLGMTGEYTAGFALSVDKSGKFAPKVQLSYFKLSDVRVTRQEAAALDEQDWMKDLLTQSATGKVDSRRAPRAGVATAPTGRALTAVSAAVKVCGKACGEHGDPCTLPQGHTEGCKPPPF